MANQHIVPGIGVGGMADKYEIKILICYLLHSVNTQLSKDQLSLIFQEDHLVNYFIFCDALQGLIEAGHLSIQSENGDEFYSLNPLGIETAERLDRKLPKSLRDNVVSTAMRLIARLKIERENTVDIRPTQNGYTVTCISHDADFEMLRLELYAPDELQAQCIRDRFLSDPARIYRHISEILIDDDSD